MSGNTTSTARLNLIINTRSVNNAALSVNMTKAQVDLLSDAKLGVLPLISPDVFNGSLIAADRFSCDPRS